MQFSCKIICHKWKCFIEEVFWFIVYAKKIQESITNVATQKNQATHPTAGINLNFLSKVLLL